MMRLLETDESRVFVQMPGRGLIEVDVLNIREDKDGILCIFFAKDGVLGAEAFEEFEYNGEYDFYVHIPPTPKK